MIRLNWPMCLLFHLCFSLLLCISPCLARSDPPPLALCPHYNELQSHNTPHLSADSPYNYRFNQHIQHAKRFSRPYSPKLPPLPHTQLSSAATSVPLTNQAAAATNDTIEASLMDFYTQSGGSQWVYRAAPQALPWGSPGPYCNWFGVMCDNNGFIWKIDLSDIRLSGFVRRPFVGLVNLTQLDLSTNCMYSVDNTFFDLSHLPLLQLFSIATQWNLIADIPDSFFDGLPNLLQIDLSYTGVSVNMAQFTRLPKLQGIAVQGISISGRMSDLAPLHSTLAFFAAGNAQSPVQTLYDFAGFNMLQEIDVTAMVLEGSLPSFNLPQLNYLSVEQTAISGPIPPQQLPSLTQAFFDETQLIGDFSSLYNCSQLRDLSLSLTLDLVLNLDEICIHWPNLRSLGVQYSVVQGSLMSLNNCSKLQNFSMEGVGITGEFPPLTNPSLLFVDLSSNSLTSLPETILLPALAHLDLQHNLISGSVPSFVNTNALQYLDLSNNRLNSTLPTFQPASVTDCSNLPLSLNMLLLNNNQFTGNIPPCYPFFPNLNALSLGFNNLAGALPNFTHSASYLQFILLESNQFTGRIPSFNLSYLQLLSVVNNSLSDSLDFTRPDIHLPLLFDARFDNNFFHCPIQFPPSSFLMFLSVASNLFNSSCASMTFLSSISHLKSFDGSFNAWNGEALPLVLPNELKTFSCTNCGYIAQLPTTWQTLSNLRSVFLSGNTIQGLLEQTPFYIVLLDLSNCSLSGDLFSSVLYSSSLALDFAGSNLLTLNLGRNRISGRLSRSLFDKSVPGFNFVGNLQELRMNNNLLTGPLPPASTGWQMQTLDFTGNQFIGEIPESYVNFKELRELRFGNNPGLRAPPNKPLPAFMSVSTVFDTAPSAGNGFACPTITLAANPTAIVTLDPSYYNYTFCQCVDKFFGHNNLCFPVPDTCQAKGQTISGCQPVQVDAQGTFVFLPCPLTIVGQSLCNPDGIDWPAFDVSVNLLDLTKWCYKGHEGRVCSKCQPNYFASGRWCVKCLGNGLHYLVFIACALLVPALCIFLYVKAPRVATLIDAISHLHTQQQLKKEFNEDNTNVVRPKDVDASSALLSSSPASHRLSPELIIAAVKHASISESNAWKLLLFHTQSLGILLSTQTALPSVLVTFVSVVSSGSGFSFSSLLALECVTNWTLAHKVWASLVLPVAVIVVAVLLRILERWHQKQSAGIEDIDDDTVVITPSALTLFVWKSYGVCWSVLYVLVFPSAQLALSAIGCTDWREGGQEAYLNLFSWIQCDSDWRQNILPVALIAVIFWLVIFPIGSTWMLFHLGRQLRKGELQTWSVLGQLCAQYRANCWNWEQVVLLRRLGLVTVLAIVPSYSLYLPLLLFSLIQLSALAQHAIAPYQNAWNHRAELASLYILLINYVTALVLDQNSSSNNSDTSNGGLSINAWAILLLIVNVLFILILVASLSHQLQQKLLRMFRQAYRSTFGEDSIRQSFGQSLLNDDQSINPSEQLSEGKEEEERNTIALDVRKSL